MTLFSSQNTYRRWVSDCFFSRLTENVCKISFLFAESTPMKINIDNIIDVRIALDDIMCKVSRYISFTINIFSILLTNVPLQNAFAKLTNT